jgi:hypothetical protein
MKDKVFSREIEKKFEFDEAVASVFDDMLSRSVPFYDEVRRLIISLILADEADGKRYSTWALPRQNFYWNSRGRCRLPCSSRG